MNSKLIVHFQRYDSSGNRIGFPDSVINLNTNSNYPEVAMNYNGSFVIAWQDDRFHQGNFDIYMQRFNSSGIPIAPETVVNNDNNPSTYHAGPKVGSDGKGASIVTWVDERSCPTGEIYYQLYDSSGNTVGTNRKANNSPCATGVSVPSSISVRNDKKFFIYWTDFNYTGTDKSHGRRFDENGNPIGLQFQIPSVPALGTTQRADYSAVLGDRLFCTWNANTGYYDIYCSVRSFQNPDSVIGINIISNNVPGSFKLYPAYPNPFNPSTTIKYDLPKDTRVTIKVFDLTGREVVTLVNANQNAGYHEVNFDGTQFASGVYFFRIEAGTFTDVKKMVLIK